jgi:XTP/dITP diphosphohydrolase
MQITYITSNPKKLLAAQEEFVGCDIVLNSQSLDIPEVQAETVDEVAREKAIEAAMQLQCPVVVTDGGFEIEALNGFPGPFTKYVNKWFSAQDLIYLMADKDNRKIFIVECLAYCEPGKEPILFTNRIAGEVAKIAGKEGWSPFNQVFIPEEYDKVLTEIPEEELSKFFGLNWKQFKEFLLNR